ncbi:MAG: cyclopropane-fatty-acyl-phospholipid synthase family protein [Woeseiaceae bacterium]|nr:cyclopropane-fatty-acyl-phospholipid synthase family protein [Woeseiaceae bacterium]
MKPVSIASDQHMGASAAAPTLFDKLARRAVLRALSTLRYGSLTLVDGDETHRFGNPDSDLEATITVTDRRFYADVAFGGAVGGGEAWFRSFWETDSLTEVVRILARNRPVLENMDSGAASLTRPLRRLFHWLHRNTQSGSRRNISAHYDLGNDFFELWLDGRMQYSSAIFEEPGMSLDAAQEAKLERLCRKLALTPDDHLLEIGTGWGGLAMYAAEHFGCRVTTTTISAEQFEYASRRVRDAGLADRITLLKKDYRELEGRYDKIVSVEMFEAVGHRYHGTFFSHCAGLLNPGGLMVLQTITIADQRFEAAARSVDFIQRYIFPGGCLPSLTSIASTLTRFTDLRITHVEDIGPHYATTLRHWHDRMFARIDDVVRQGYSSEFIRMWQYYLCYCEGGFLERVIGNIQIIAGRPDTRTEPFIA